MRQLEESQVTIEMLNEILEGQKKKRKHGGGAGDGLSRRRNRLYNNFDKKVWKSRKVSVHDSSRLS